VLIAVARGIIKPILDHLGYRDETLKAKFLEWGWLIKWVVE
jgi:hypothetical protein